MKRLKVISLLVGLIAASSVYAVNETIVSANDITLKNNDTVQLSMSSNQMNRIYVTNDLISNVNCPSGFCEIASNKNDQNGSLYIRYKTQETFTYFISTKNGYHFGVEVTPKITKKGDTVAFTVLGGNAKSLENENASDYSNLIIKRMKSLIKNKQDDAWVARPVEATKENTLTINGIKVEPLVIYQGEKLSGYLSKITNTTKAQQSLTESEFYVTGNRAIALSKSSLLPNESAKLYVLK